MRGNVILIIFSLAVLTGLCYVVGNDLWSSLTAAFFFTAISISVCVQVVEIIKKLEIKR